MWKGVGDLKVLLSEKEELGLFLQLDGIADYKCDGYKQSGKNEQSDKDEQQPYDDDLITKTWDHDKSGGDVSFDEDLYK